MRGILLFFVALLTVTATSAQQSLTQAWDKANTAYVNADYDGAIIIYDSIAEAGYGGPKLYYNLANAYFKKGVIGKSILNYNRALLVDPSDSDVKYNLRIANSYVKDNIESVPEFFLKSWVRAWRSSFSSDSWAIISIVMLMVTLGAVLLYLLSGVMRLRKLGFYLAIISLIITLFAVIFAFAEKQNQQSSNGAIIMISAAPVKSSPDNSSKDIFILHEGTKVEVVSELSQWREVTIADGKKGWILESSIEMIRR